MSKVDLTLGRHSLDLIISMIVGLFCVSLVAFGSGCTDYKIEEFNKNQSKILAEINALIDTNDYDAAISKSEEYRSINNEELRKLYQKAKSLKDKQTKDLERAVLSYGINYLGGIFSERIVSIDKVTKIDKRTFIAKGDVEYTIHEIGMVYSKKNKSYSATILQNEKGTWNVTNFKY